MGKNVDLTRCNHIHTYAVIIMKSVKSRSKIFYNIDKCYNI